MKILTNRAPTTMTAEPQTPVEPLLCVLWQRFQVLQCRFGGRTMFHTAQDFYKTKEEAEADAANREERLKRDYPDWEDYDYWVEKIAIPLSWNDQSNT